MATAALTVKYKAALRRRVRDVSVEAQAGFQAEPRQGWSGAALLKRPERHRHRQERDRDDREAGRTDEAVGIGHAWAHARGDGNSGLLPERGLHTNIAVFTFCIGKNRRNSYDIYNCTFLVELVHVTGSCHSVQ